MWNRSNLIKSSLLLLDWGSDPTHINPYIYEQMQVPFAADCIFTGIQKSLPEILNSKT